MNAFTAPKKSLGNLDAEAAATLIAAAADVALIIDSDGIIRDLAVHTAELAAELESRGKWLGRRWVDTVTQETRGKIEALLREAAASAPPRWRQVNHPSLRTTDVPVLYSAVLVGSGRVVAFGRDLRAISELQQRLVDAQQSMERDYSRLRHVETRYRLLFEMSSEAVLILDAASQKTVEANPAARHLLGDPAGRMLGRPFAEAFDSQSGTAVQALLAGLRSSGRAEDVRVRTRRWRARGGRLGRAVPAGERRLRPGPPGAAARRVRRRRGGRPGRHAGSDAAVVPHLQARLIKVVESAPDGFVVTDPEGAILTANAAFVEMAQLAAEEQARGQPLERWLGRPGVDLNVLIDQSAPARLGAAVRDHAARRVRRHHRGRDLGGLGDQWRPALLGLRHPQRRPPAGHAGARRARPAALGGAADRADRPRAR